MLLERQDSGSGFANARYFVYGNYIDEVLLMVDDPAGSPEDYYFGQDHLYSTAVLFDDTGAVVERYEYSTYGDPHIMDASYNSRSSSNYENPYLFTGRRLDILDTDGSLKIYYYRARYYCPQTGRFLQRDPLQYVNSLNIYQYVMSGPVQSVDPYGLLTSPFPGTDEEHRQEVIQHFGGTEPFKYGEGTGAAPFASVIAAEAAFSIEVRAYLRSIVEQLNNSCRTQGRNAPKSFDCRCCTPWHCRLGERTFDKTWWKLERQRVLAVTRVRSGDAPYPTPLPLVGVNWYAKAWRVTLEKETIRRYDFEVPIKCRRTCQLWWWSLDKQVWYEWKFYSFQRNYWVADETWLEVIYPYWWGTYTGVAQEDQLPIPPGI